jgi:hypothetical protein
MTDHFAKSARPATAAIAWCTKDELFVEIPTLGGPPFICRYKKTTSGLASALNVLIENEDRPKRSLDQSSHPLIRKNDPAIYTEAHRERVRNILKRMKIT